MHVQFNVANWSIPDAQLEAFATDQRICRAGLVFNAL